MIDGVQLLEQPLFKDDRGEVRRGVRSCDDGFTTFGEAYVSGVRGGVVKGWKKHTRMHSNLVVINGGVCFIIHDLRDQSGTHGMTVRMILTEAVNHRLVVPCGLWMAFQGINAGINRILNVSSIIHDPAECETLPLQNELLPSFDWERLSSAT